MPILSQIPTPIYQWSKLHNDTIYPQNIASTHQFLQNTKQKYFTITHYYYMQNQSPLLWQHVKHIYAKRGSMGNLPWTILLQFLCFMLKMKFSKNRKKLKFMSDCRRGGGGGGWREKERDPMMTLLLASTHPRLLTNWTNRVCYYVVSAQHPKSCRKQSCIFW